MPCYCHCTCVYHKNILKLGHKLRHWEKGYAMKEFDYSKYKMQSWDNEILAYVAQIHEYKGKQNLFLKQKPVELNRLEQIARIQSTESSNQIEGIITTNARLKQLVADKTTPRNRDEQEILGYRNVLNLVHENYDAIPIKGSYILQLHGEMLKYTAFSYGGRYKNTPNEIDMVLENGEKVILFKPLEPFETPDAIDRLCEEFQKELDTGIVDPLILIPLFVLDFLCIHPFNDGNGRMSRILTLLLLYRSGYVVGQYVSIEKAIAETKESYYEALRAADENWHESANDPTPFIKYMLGIVLSCYREFETRITIASKTGNKSNAYDIVKAYAESTIGQFSKQDALISCPSLGSSSVEAALKKLVEDGTIKRIGSGRNTKYVFK